MQSQLTIAGQEIREGAFPLAPKREAAGNVSTPCRLNPSSRPTYFTAALQAGRIRGGSGETRKHWVGRKEVAPSFSVAGDASQACISRFAAYVLKQGRRFISVFIRTSVQPSQRSWVLPRSRPASPCCHSKGDSSLQLFFRGSSSLHRASRPSSWVKP